ncbi:MAG: class I SAM-dependent methyltransferase [Planctomycetota bacterium]
MNRVSFRDAKRVSDYAEKRYRGQLQRRLSKWELAIVSRILRRIGAEDAAILDIPCGYGRFAELVRREGADLLAADISRDMVLKTASVFGGGKFLVADAAAIPLADGSVDGTITVRLLQHLSDRDIRVRIMSELGRVAGKFVIVSFYDRDGLHSLQRLVKKKSRRTRKHIEFLTRFQFLSEAGQAGLEIDGFFPVRRIFHAQVFALLRPKP